MKKDKEAKNTVDLMDCLIYNKKRKEIKKKEKCWLYKKFQKYTQNINLISKKSCGFYIIKPSWEKGIDENKSIKFLFSSYLSGETKKLCEP